MLKVLGKILGPLEIISLGITIIGLAITQLELLMVGMSLLSGVYFLNGYRPLEFPADGRDDEAPRDFFHLLATSICVKAAWIACAAALIGALFRLLHLNGALEMLTVGCSVLAVSIVIMGIYAVTRPGGRALVPVLYRAIPVCLLGVYLFLNKPI
jgi:hypothetical protein